MLPLFFLKVDILSSDGTTAIIFVCAAIGIIYSIIQSYSKWFFYLDTRENLLTLKTFDQNPTVVSSINLEKEAKDAEEACNVPMSLSPKAENATLVANIESGSRLTVNLN